MAKSAVQIKRDRKKATSAKIAANRRRQISKSKER